MRRSGTDIQASLQELAGRTRALDGKRLVVGVQKEAGKNRFGETLSASDDLMMIAHVQEYGQHITPKHSKYLSVPIHAEAMGKSPRNFDGFFFTSRNGNLIFARKNDATPSGMEPLFAMVDSVTIPARPFVAKGYAKVRHGVLESADWRNDVAAYMRGEATLEVLIDTLGKRLAEVTADAMVTVTPASSSAYKNRKADAGGSPQTLVYTGELRRHITYRGEG